jgi:hypothetical protein
MWTYRPADRQLALAASLPFACIAILRTLDAAAQSIVAIGPSSAAGAGVQRSAASPAGLEAMRARRIQTVVLARGGGGRGAGHVSYGGLDRRTDILDDGIHPSPLGRRKIAQRLLQSVEKSLESYR